MSPHKIRRAYKFMGLYALALFVLHNVINAIVPHLSILKELVIIHVIIYAMCVLDYAVSKFLIDHNRSYKLLIVLGSITAKMFVALTVILLFYFLKENNMNTYIFSFLIVYLLYLPVITYFFVKDFK
ncbi:hypothetical protein ACE1ET_02190 [Saccharicrinis sp. FJH62]|uniref:hypothetical protein n=1 Tax=Saccharicrinis sp. FJH62 TaxID=3344657 RepID=UPI0035D4833E